MKKGKINKLFKAFHLWETNECRAFITDELLFESFLKKLEKKEIFLQLNRKIQKENLKKWLLQQLETVTSLR